MRTRGKLLLTLLAIGLLPMAVVAFLAYDKAASSLRDSAEQAQEDRAHNGMDKLDRNLFERYGDVQAYAKSDPAKSMNPARVREWIDTMMSIYTPIYKLMVVADRRGRIVAVNRIGLDGEPIDSRGLIGRNVRGERWFSKAVGGGLGDAESFVESLHEDELMAAVYGGGADSYAMNFTFPIKNDRGRIVGVWTNRFNWDVTGDIISAEEERAHESGEESTRMFVLDRAGTVIYSDDPAQILNLKPARETVVERALDDGAIGAIDGDPIDGEGDEQILGYQHSEGFSSYPGLDWSVISSQDESEALEEADDLRFTTILVGLLCALGLGIVAFLIARTVAQRVGEVKRNAETITASTAQILAAVNQHTTSANEQAAAITETSTSIEEIRVAAEQAAVKAEDVAQQADSSVEVGEEGSRAVESIEGGMQEIQERVDAIAQDILALSEQTQQIGEITKTVNDLADQSNLLAFNATIEAAKAGEQGKGFAVVADEVRNLAEQSKQATAQVQAILSEIQKATNAAVMAAEQGTSTVKTGTERASRAGEVIAQLADINREAAQAAQQIAALARQQNAGMDQIAQAMQDTNQATNQFVEGAREQQTAAEQLDLVARELSELASRYKV